MTLADTAQPMAIAVDATDVYWTDASGAVMRVPIVGGSPATLASAQDGPYAIAVDASNVYWTNTGGTMLDAGSVAAVPKRGGTPLTLASGVTLPQAIAVDATGVYWSNSVPAGAPSYALLSLILRTPLDGGAPVTLTSVPDAFPIAMRIAGADLYWAGIDVLVDGPIPDGVYEVPLSGGAVTTIIASEAVEAPTSLAADGERVYWTDGTGDNAVVAATVQGGAVTTLASRATTEGSGIAVDNANVYWTNRPVTSTSAGGALLRVPRNGGAVTTLATASQTGMGLAAIALDATSVYWTGGGAIERLTPR